MPEEKHIPMTLSQNGIHLPNGRGIFVGNWDLRKFIVKACNSYTQDQETIKALVDACDKVIEVLDMNLYDGSNDPWAQGLIDIANAALAKVKRNS